MEEQQKPVHFSEEGITAIKELCEVLLRIRKRLIAEGKAIEVDEHYVNRKRDNAGAGDAKGH